MVNDVVFSHFDVPDGLSDSISLYFPLKKLKERLQEWEKAIPIKFLNQPYFHLAKNFLQCLITMSDFYFPCKRNRIIKALEGIGLQIEKKEGNHDRTICPKIEKKTEVSRHNDIKSGVVKSIYKFLIE